MGRQLIILPLLLLTIYCNGQDGYVEGHPKLAYWKVGSKKEVVIVLHGGPGAAHAYLRPEFDELSQVARVVYYDQRGCGQSQPATTYEWQAHVEDLNRVIKTFSKNRKVVLVGSSWGSVLAMLFAYKHPEKVNGLILSGTINWQGRGFDSVQYAKYKLSHTVSTEVVTSNDVQVGTITMSEHRQVDTRNALPIEINRAVQIRIHGQAPIRDTQLSVVTAPVFDSLRTMSVPILIFNGNHKDCSIDWGDRYKTIFANSTLHTINQACHDPWFSSPVEFMARSIQFVKDVTNR